MSIPIRQIFAPLCGLLLAFAAGCSSTRSTGKIAHAEWPSPPPLPAQAEQRIEGVAHYAAGLSRELNNEPAIATDHYYKAALADLDQEALVLDVARRLVREQKPAQAVDLLKKASTRPNASGELYAWLGLAHLQAGSTNLALEANSTAIQKVPDNLAAYQNLAQLHLQLGQTNQALSVIDQACARTNAPPEFLLGLAELVGRFNRQQVYSDSESRGKILQLLGSANTSATENPLVQQRIADLYLLHGEPLKAEPIYAELFKRYPEAPGLREKLANIYIRTDQNEKAAQLLETIRRDNPTDPSTYYFLGSLAYEAKQYDRAAEAFETALRLNPNFEPVYFDLAGVHLARGKPEQALRVLSDARAKFKLNFLLEFYTGIAKAANEEFNEALGHLTSAELIAKTSEPQRLNHSFYFQLGSTYERAGNIPESVKAFRKCLELSPDFAEALNYLGYMWAERGENLDEARSLIDKALQKEPDNPAFLDSMAWVLFKLGRPEEALPYMNRAIALADEPDPTLLDHLGDIHLALKEFDKAKDAFTRALAVKPDEKIQQKLDQLRPR